MKDKKKKKRVFFTVDERVSSAFRDHIDLVGYDPSKLFEKILRNFLKKNKKLT